MVCVVLDLYVLQSQAALWTVDRTAMREQPYVVTAVRAFADSMGPSALRCGPSEGAILPTHEEQRLKLTTVGVDGGNETEIGRAHV